MRNNWIVERLRKAGINPSFLPSGGTLKHATEDVFNGEKHIVFSIGWTVFYVNTVQKTYTTETIGEWVESQPVYCGMEEE